MKVVITDNAALARGHNSQTSRAAEDQLAFAEQHCLLVLGGGGVGVRCAVGQGVRSFEYDEGSLALVGCRGRTLYVDGCTVGVGEVHPVEGDTLFAATIKLEEAVGSRAAQLIHHMLFARIDDGHVITVDGHSEIIGCSCHNGIAMIRKGHINSLGESGASNVVAHIVRGGNHVNADDVVLLAACRKKCPCDKKAQLSKKTDFIHYLIFISNQRFRRVVYCLMQDFIFLT